MNAHEYNNWLTQTYEKNLICKEDLKSRTRPNRPEIREIQLSIEESHNMDEKECELYARNRLYNLEHNIKSEFKRISRSNTLNNCIKNFYYCEVYFKGLSAPEEYPLYFSYAYDENGINSELNEHLDYLLKNYIQTNYSNNDRILLEEPERILGILEFDMEKYKHGESTYFSGAYYSGIDPMRYLDYHFISAIMIEMDTRTIYKEFGYFSNRLNPYFLALMNNWRIHDSNFEKNFCYNELFRKSSHLNGFLRRYETGLNTLALLKYEGSNNVGSIIAPAEEEYYKITIDYPYPPEEYQKRDKFTPFESDFEIEIEFEDKIAFVEENYKKIRKLLQMCTDQTSLLLDSDGYFFGIGKVQDVSYYYKVEFMGYNHWMFYNFGLKFLEFVNMTPCFPDTIAKLKENAISMLKKTFGDIEVDSLISIIDHATKQTHGTMVVFSENAKEEAIRLRKSDFLIKPKRLKGKFIEFVTSIDGAVLCDEFGNCYAIGVILDGIATDKADSSKGARHNSAIRYIEQQKLKNAKAFIIVVSEDRYITCLSTAD